jgi:hypothetical protein
MRPDEFVKLNFCSNPIWPAGANSKMSHFPGDLFDFGPIEVPPCLAVTFGEFRAIVDHGNRRPFDWARIRCIHIPEGINPLGDMPSGHLPSFQGRNILIAGNCLGNDFDGLKEFKITFIIIYL